MATEKLNPFAIMQLEEALEERQTPDRRKSKSDTPPTGQIERRKGDRRVKKTK